MKISEASFKDLKKIGKGYYASFDKLHSIDDFEIHLNQFISSGAYYYEGKIIEVRQLVDRVNGIKIEIYANEHPPPHFHIVSNGNKASLTLDDGRVLHNNGFDSKVIKRIQNWFENAKERLIAVWNETRPDGCVVGKIE